MKTFASRNLRQLSFALVALLVSNLHAQGPLAPGGPPGPTMKTLQQVEPRIPIDSLPLTITQSGSYYFTRNLQFTATTGDAIRVLVPNVTIDLMGFTLSSASGVTGDAIVFIGGSTDRCTVQNGTITGTTTVTITGTTPDRTWTVSAGGFNRGISALSAQDARFLGLTVSRCRTNGIEGGPNSLVERSTASHNGADGLTAVTVTGCTSSNNGDEGIVATDGTVTGSTARDNGGIGISNAETVANSTGSRNGTNGISGETVTNCTALQNDLNGIDGDTITNSNASSNGDAGISSGDVVTNCTASNNGGNGIFARNITGCIANSNALHGIRVVGTATNNDCRDNGTGTQGAGIYFSTDGVRIEGNNLFNNIYGIQGATGAGGFIARNTLQLTQAGRDRAQGFYSISTEDCVFGPIHSGLSNGQLGSSGAAVHPWANFLIYL